ncbi:SDR family NAD(P)-dependent oxidoreductase [Enemella sp. A6]|uniref:SDR family NAD(P)-dependent oxidoreductase n=1 Tax=Enemella sp. A6 TaxID=3440152 RepID=UPI003EBFA184
MNRFSERRVLITGAGSGIGRATTLRLAAEGAEIFALDISAEGMAETVSMAENPERITTRVTDVTDERSVIDGVAEAAEKLGGFDVLLNIVGVHLATPMDGLDMAVVRKTFDINVMSVFMVTREALPHLRDGGAIVSMCSLSMHQAYPYMTAYAASKGAVLGFSRTLAAELLPRRIRVNTVSPGGTNTPLTFAVQGELGELSKTDIDLSFYRQEQRHFGFTEPDQVAGVIAFVASDEAAHMTGTDVRFDGGAHIS